MLYFLGLSVIIAISEEYCFNFSICENTSSSLIIFSPPNIKLSSKYLNSIGLDCKYFSANSLRYFGSIAGLL